MENLVELKREELQEVEGGTGWGPIVGMYVLMEAALNPTAHYEAFMEGWNAARE
ncbi:hypothetical protein [Ekhidna sp.]|uniref:hypothetical protein n=1 Tax=Ekhidna sp. TaxID=2608089 RepID=UPI003B58FA0E